MAITAAETAMYSLEERIAQLEAENARLREAKANTKLTLKVSEKGGVSVYGMGRWPVTLYRGQWEVLFKNVDRIKTFITDNAAMLAEKE